MTILSAAFLILENWQIWGRVRAWTLRILLVTAGVWWRSARGGWRRIVIPARRLTRPETWSSTRWKRQFYLVMISDLQPLLPGNVWRSESSGGGLWQPTFTGGSPHPENQEKVRLSAEPAGEGPSQAGSGTPTQQQLRRASGQASGAGVSSAQNKVSQARQSLASLLVFCDLPQSYLVWFIVIRNTQRDKSVGGECYQHHQTKTDQTSQTWTMWTWHWADLSPY